jgi:flagella basal body P-ring formation protein FlgA
MPGISPRERIEPLMTTCKRCLRMALAQGLIFGCALTSARATDICFKPNATVAGATVTLKDVATVSGGDAATVSRLEQTVLGPAPAPGRSARLEFDEIRSRLEATGLSTGDTSFSGSTIVQVSCTQAATPVVKKPRRRAPVNVTAAQVHRAEKIVTQSFRQSLRGKNRQAANWFLEVSVDPGDVPIVLAGATEGFEFGAIDPHNTNPQNVDVNTEDSHGRAHRFQIQCVVSEKPRVPVLNRTVSTGEVIREDDLAWKQVDNTEGLLTKFEQVIGKEAKKGLHADDPLRADDVRTIPLVRNNDIVTGVWRRGGICITAQFKAKADGGKGDVIALVQLTGRDQVLGRVTDVHEAEIVSADAARPRNGDAAGDADEQAADDVPVQPVVHKSRRKRHKAPPAVINADGVAPATGDNGLANSPAATGALAPADNPIKPVRAESTESSPQ